MQGLVLLALMAGAAYGQAGVPRFTQDGLPRRADGKPVLLAPGMFVELYGEDLGPGPGVRVLVDGHPAELLYTSAKQINFKIPDEAPEDGVAPIQVCVYETCSDRLEVRFSLRKAFIHLQGHAYVHMPVWMEVEQPGCCATYYPYNIFPLDFEGAKFEVLHNGEPLPPLPGFTGMIIGKSTMPLDASRARLPLHLIYPFDQPGVYSVRFMERAGEDSQSDWTDIVVEPYSDAQRVAWLRAEAVKARSASVGELVGDIIPSLLAWRDDRALAVLLTLVDHPDDLVRRFARVSLDLFDEDLQRRVIPASRWDEIHIRMFAL